MAHTILEKLRRRSKASFNKNSDQSTDSSTDGSGIATQSSSTVNSASGGATPPLLTNSTSSSDLHNLGTLPPPTRPTLSTASSSKRQSVSGMSGLGMQSPQSPPSSLPSSPYAPRITSINDKQWVYQKTILISGIIGDPSTLALDGNIIVTRYDDAFPPLTFKVHGSHFKTCLPLMPGKNVLRFDFTSPKLSNNSTSNPIHSTTITLHMIPPQSGPPVQLVILLASDSPATFDAPPGRIEKEGNGLDVAIQKFRMTGYLWQAFTAENMSRNKLQRRTFRMEEEWVTGTSNYRDRQNKTMRSEAKVHIVRCDKTVKEIQDIERAQQNPNGTKTGDLLTIAAEAMKNYFQPLPNQTQLCAVLLLDSHWDKERNLIRGHAAVTGSAHGVNVALFGSHALHSYPSCFEEIVPAFTDCTPTDTNHVANDCNESGSSWEAANIGIGAHLHELGHLFGCPHEERGIMLRDYVTFSRSFITNEPYSTRTKFKAGLVLREDECAWHRLDTLRFRSHLSFALPNDPPRQGDDSIQVWPVENEKVIVTAASGVAFYEVFLEGDIECHYWEEYGYVEGPNYGSHPKQIILTEAILKNSVPENRKTAKFQKICIKSKFGGSLDIDNFATLASKASKVKLSNGRLAFRSRSLGLSQLDGSTPEEIVFHSTVQKTKLLTQVRVYHGNFVDGMEFIYEDSTTQLFGKRGGTPGGSEFNLDTRRGEVISGFYVRSGHWIDGIAIITSLGRKSPLYGQPNGSESYLIPPIGYSLAGVTGSSAAWVDGFAMDKQKKLLSEDNSHFTMIKMLHLADLITELNGFCGVMSIFSSMRYCLGPPSAHANLWYALAFMPFGLFFDFMDGKVARWRKKSSLMGQELDSLADLVSFGLSPAAAAFAIGLRTPMDHVFLTFFVLCGLTRLARFNITVANVPKDDTGKSKYFEGTPIPTSLSIAALMAYWVGQGWILDDLPMGTWATGTVFEFHPVVGLFILSGCLMTSKTLHVPKP
ncbi:uncharacterized protein LY89DRAFT_700567 [Mollisia scopiformis]|uniref:CDP-diacylglycerol--serine O-phosphatidyltransferase n=1 Tax=Mollisia scopiformis TaxID=149040 RepID=A0A194WSD1_MOLSC|nr:uncharacterized protein LY89DRAFT_700567 [Mollisia scopiformis]KUJ10604.1 hypothetical protein LY89DRAFT_700567 [Mollisia scopiformis]